MRKLRRFWDLIRSHRITHQPRYARVRRSLKPQRCLSSITLNQISWSPPRREKKSSARGSPPHSIVLQRTRKKKTSLWRLPHRPVATINWSRRDRSRHLWTLSQSHSSPRHLNYLRPMSAAWTWYVEIQLPQPVVYQTTRLHQLVLVVLGNLVAPLVVSVP